MKLSPVRKATDMATTRCWCSGRKSLPVCCCRMNVIAVATSSSGRSSRPHIRRPNSTSGTVSISKEKQCISGLFYYGERDDKTAIVGEADMAVTDTETIADPPAALGPDHERPPPFVIGDSHIP